MYPRRRRPSWPAVGSYGRPGDARRQDVEVDECAHYVRAEQAQLAHHHGSSVMPHHKHLGSD
jgi:hypothetical protein